MFSEHEATISFPSLAEKKYIKSKCLIIFENMRQYDF